MGKTFIWTDHMIARLAVLARSGARVSAMMGEFGCSESSLRARIEKYARSLPRDERIAFWTEREANLKGQPRAPFVVPAVQHQCEPTSVTAAFFGDPPPGRSALDQRNQAQRGA